MITPKALKHLSEVDSKMATLIMSHNVERFKIRENSFHGLVESIISQQLSTKAAATIRKRFRDLLGSKNYTYRHILKTSADQLRAVGLSANKARYIQGLAAAMEAKTLDFKKLAKMEDEQVIEELVKHKGVGRWTAEMFLIFTLGRPDVFSLGDWGLRNAIIRIHKPKNTDPGTILKISEKWKPYRSTACLYLWASLDNAPKVK